jgi:hypothetical protein
MRLKIIRNGMSEGAKIKTEAGLKQTEIGDGQQ